MDVDVFVVAVAVVGVVGCTASPRASSTDAVEASSESSSSTTTTTTTSTTTSTGVDGSSSSEGSSSTTTGVVCTPASTLAPPEPNTLVGDPLAPFPASLSRTGLYPSAPDLSVVADVAIHYEPAWPLWSNGSDKHRYLVLPEGGQVDTSDPERWSFPVGTLLFKTFLYPVDDACAQPVETRVMRKNADAVWEYAAYVWEEDDAMRVDLAERTPIDVGDFVHNVPARIECRACHESAVGEVLGFERLQLADAVVDLHEAGVLSAANEVVRIEHRDDVARDVLGMFQGNCVHCHNGSGGPSSSFDLRHEVAFANTIDVPTQSSASASGIRIVPGSPETSILFLAFSGETEDPEVSAMPPMGVDVQDAAAVELLRGFIEEL